jgi:hypothetical protein
MLPSLTSPLETRRAGAPAVTATITSQYLMRSGTYRALRNHDRSFQRADVPTRETGHATCYAPAYFVPVLRWLENDLQAAETDENSCFVGWEWLRFTQ